MNSKVMRPRHQFLTSLLICLGFSTTLVACNGDSSNSKSSPTATASAVETSMASPSAAAPVSPSAISSPIDTPSTSPIVSPTSNAGSTGTNPGTTGNNSAITGNNNGTSTPPRKRKKVKQRPAKQSETDGVIEKEGKASTNPTRNQKSDPEQEPGALDSTPADSVKPKKNSQTKKQSGNAQKPKKQSPQKEVESNDPNTSPRSPGNSDQGSDGESSPGTKPKQGSDGQ